MTVTSLDPTSYGRWLVTTVGSQHVWDITPERVLYQRLPGDHSANFVADGTEVLLTRVDRWPTVGATTFIWFDDPDLPWAVEQWRQSSTIQSITRIDSAAGASPIGSLAVNNQETS